MDKKKKIEVYGEAVLVKGYNKRIYIEKIERADKKTSNVIFIKSLTKYSGDGIGALSKITENKKIKETSISFSNEGIIDLYVALHHYIRQIDTISDL